MREPVPIEDQVQVTSRRQRGRPSKFTVAARNRVLAAIRTGSYFEPACRSASISFQTFRNWVTRGEREQSGPYFDFFVAVKAAESDAELRAVKFWSQAMRRDWRAAKEFLERRHPSRWSPREHGSDSRTSLTVMLAQLEDRARAFVDPRGTLHGSGTLIDAMYLTGPYAPQLSREESDISSG